MSAGPGRQTSGSTSSNRLMHRARRSAASMALRVEGPEVLEGGRPIPDGPHGHADAVAARVGQQRGDLRRELGARRRR